MGGDDSAKNAFSLSSALCRKFPEAAGKKLQEPCATPLTLSDSVTLMKQRCTSQILYMKLIEHRNYHRHSTTGRIRNSVPSLVIERFKRKR